MTFSYIANGKKLEDLPPPVMIGESLFKNKTAIMRTVTSMYARLGNGFDIRIKADLLCVSVDLINFSNGAVSQKEVFTINLQEGNEDVCADLAERAMERAFRNMGVEFTSIREFLENA